MKKIVFVLALMCLSFSALADVYAVHNIHVDTTAENATKAKEQGIAAAQEKAFYKMLERLTLVKDLDSLPVLSTEDILNLVRDFSVSHEKTSSVRYIADVDVQFNANAVQNFFQTNRLPYVNVVAEKSLIFPVYRTPDEVLLWKDANPWATALSNVASSSDLVPLVVPLGDVDDMKVINEDNLAQEENLNIASLLKRYHCKNALIADFAFLAQGNIVHVKVRPFHGEKAQLDTIEITEPIDAQMNVVLKRIAQRVVSLLEQSWREKNAVRFDDPVQVEINVHIQDLAEWLEIRKQLDKITLIKQYVVKSLRPDKAEIEMFYVGEFDTIKSILQKDNLYIIETKDGLLLKKMLNAPSDLVEEITKTDDVFQNADVVADEADVVADEADVVADEVNNNFLLESVKKEADVENPSDIRTFGADLYEQIQPETLDMFEQMKKEI